MDRTLEWVACSDRMPTEERSYFCWFQEDYAVLPFRLELGWRWAGGDYMLKREQDEVTHWMPLPEPPKCPAK